MKQKNLNEYPAHYSREDVEIAQKMRADLAEKKFTAFNRTNAKMGLYQKVGFVYASSEEMAKKKIRDELGYKLRSGDQIIKDNGEGVRVI